MKKIIFIIGLMIVSSAAEAAGWNAVKRNPRLLGSHPSCGFGTPVLASFYNSGRVTASGARFHPNGVSVAHRTLPFGTSVTFTNPRNGRTVTAAVNDRGPWGRAAALGVKFDLSQGAARSIGMGGSQWLCASY